MPGRASAPGGNQARRNGIIGQGHAWNSASGRTRESLKHSDDIAATKA
jgi:hypothetical protein